MKRIFVRLQTSGKSAPVVFELPGEMIVKDIVTNLIQCEGWEKINNGISVQYWLATQDGQPIDENTTLSETGVKNMDTLIVVSNNSESNSTSVKQENFNSTPVGTQAQRSKLPPPEWKKVS